MIFVDTDAISDFMYFSGVTYYVIAVTISCVLIVIQYRRIKKDTADEIPTSVEKLVLYVWVMLLTTLLFTLASNTHAGGHTRLAYILAEQLGLVSNVAYLCFALAINEFVRMFHKKEITKYSKLMIFIFLIALVSQLTQAIMVFFVDRLPDIIEYATQFVIWLAIILAIIIMIKVRSLSRGSVLANVLGFLILSVSFQSIPGIVSIEILEYTIDELDPGEDLPFSLAVISFIVTILIPFGFYFMYRALKEIRGFFDSFGNYEDRRDSASTQ